MTPTGIVTADGALHELDCVIYATGFKTNEFMFPMEITGIAAVSCATIWAAARTRISAWPCRAFRRCSSCTGPTRTPRVARSSSTTRHRRHTSRRHSSTSSARRGGIEVRQEVEATSDRELQSRFSGTAWTGCDSWYRDPNGRIVANWPGYMREYVAATRELDLTQYRFVDQPAAVAV